MCILCGYNAQRVGYYLSLHYLHTLYHDQALGHYGQEGLNTTVLPTHTNMKTNILLWNGLIYIWAATKDSPLLYGCLAEVKLLLYRYGIALLYNFTLYRITKEILEI